MKDLYIVINETKDGRFYGQCPLLKGYSIQGTSLDAVKKDMLIAVNRYLENNINLLDNIRESEPEIKKFL